MAAVGSGGTFGVDSMINKDSSPISQYAAAHGYENVQGQWYKGLQANNRTQGGGVYGMTGLTDQGIAQLMNTNSQLGAVQSSATAAAGTTAPGQDVYSQKLQQMSTGTFAPADPSYQWRLQQGEQAVERSAAAKGQLGSGNILTALTDYAQGAASQEYGAQFNRLLSASQNSTNQYTAAYCTLQGMLGQGTSQANALNAQYSTGLQANQQGFNQTAAKNTSAGAAAALSQMYQDPTGNDYWSNQAAQAAQQQAMDRASGTYTVSGYQPAQSTNNYQENYGESSGQGYVTSSSGNTSTFGGYSGDTSFGGGE